MEQPSNQISGFQYFFYTITTSLILVLVMVIVYYQKVYIPKLQTENEVAGIIAVDEGTEIAKTLSGIERPNDTDILSAADITTVLANIKKQNDEEDTELSPEERKVILDNLKSLEE